jgi:sulfate adenylyltransferase
MVLSCMRLQDGTLWPIPITLTANMCDLPEIGEEIVLRDSGFDIIWVLVLEEEYPWNFETEARSVYATLDLDHPTVAEMKSWAPVCISGRLKVFALPKHYDFVPLRNSPARLRELLCSLGNRNMVAFQTRNPMHRAIAPMRK